MEEITKFFAILDENNIVRNAVEVENHIVNIETGETEEYIPENIIEAYPEGYTLKEYLIDNTLVTKNTPSIGYRYEENLNGFVPPQPDETYILDIDDFVWNPNPDLEYDLHGDGIMYKWVPEANGWQLAE